MSEIRQDPTTKEWVILSTERGKRPSDFVHHLSGSEKRVFATSCPFCPGNESMTPHEVLSYKGASNPDLWQVRAFANGYPAVVSDGGTSRKIEQQFFLSVGGSGQHEVIVETPTHNTQLALMNDSEVGEVLRAYRERNDAMAKMPLVKSIIIFKNHGPAAGTSIEHPHSQVVAMAIVPRRMRMQYEVAIAHYDDNGRCLYADLMDRELEAGIRIVMDTDRFLVFHPFASHRPFETWIMPKANQAGFSQISPEDIWYLAQVLRVTLMKLHRGLNDPDYNLVIDSAPVGEENAEFYRWHIRIIPRITAAAGFELGSGVYINPALPEETAKFIRELEGGMEAK